MAFTHRLIAQEEINRQILEELQIKKQLLQKGLAGGGGSVSLGILQSSDFLPAGNTSVISRVGAPSCSNTSLGSFISQDSYYGNSFLPVLPRLDPPATSTNLPSTSAAAAAAVAVAIGPSTSAAAVAAAAAVNTTN